MLFTNGAIKYGKEYSIIKSVSDYEDERWLTTYKALAIKSPVTWVTVHQFYELRGLTIHRSL